VGLILGLEDRWQGAVFRRSSDERLVGFWYEVVQKGIRRRRRDGEGKEMREWGDIRTLEGHQELGSDLRSRCGYVMI
jgi:hypothetical protein